MVMKELWEQKGNGHLGLKGQKFTQSSLEVRISTRMFCG